MARMYMYMYLVQLTHGNGSLSNTLININQQHWLINIINIGNQSIDNQAKLSYNYN